MRVCLVALCAACVPGGGFDAGAPPDAGPEPDAGSGWAAVPFSGSGMRGAADGPADSAQFDAPTALAVDGEANLYVADTGNHAVRKVDPQGNVSTLQTGLLSPQGVAVDARGDVFIADTGDHCVYMLAPGGQLYDVAGTCTLGDAGFMQCGDADPHSFGGALAADLGLPMGMTVDDDAGHLYIADAYHELIRFLPLDGPGLGSVAGQEDETAFFDGECGLNFCCGTQFPTPGCELPQGSAFRGPSAVAMAPNGDVIVADSENCAVRRIGAPNGASCRVSTLAGSDCGSGTLLNAPRGVAVGADGLIYASDTANQRVVLIDPSRPLGDRLRELVGSDTLASPWGIAVGPDGRVFVVDQGHHRIDVLQPP